MQNPTYSQNGTPRSTVVTVTAVTLLVIVVLAGMALYKSGVFRGGQVSFQGVFGWQELGAMLERTWLELVGIGMILLNLLWFLRGPKNSVSESPPVIEPVAAQSAVPSSSLSERPKAVSQRSTNDGQVARQAVGSQQTAVSDSEASSERPRIDRHVATAKDMDAQLEIANSEIARLRSSLRETRDKLEQASALQKQFLSNISHELRTPLNGIMGMNELLLESELPPESRRFADNISGAATSLLSMINGLLDYSRLQAGSLRLEHVRFNLREAVEEVCAMIAPLADAKGVELVCELDESLPELVEGDHARVQQVLHNLLDNAVAFTEVGEVLLRVKAESEVNDHWKILVEVQDTGTGITPELQVDLFKAFTQADESNTRKHEGLGMGLALSRELVRLMGGEITFRSRVGDGTLFNCHMRLLSSETNRSGKPKRRSLHGARVLVVDDNETNRTILFHQLSNWGLMVDTVAGGREALQSLRKAAGTDESHDVLILDLHMPHMDGIELAQEINRDEKLKGIRTIMLTSAILDLDAEDLKHLGIDKYISKPARQSILHDSLASMMPSLGRSEVPFQVSRKHRALPATGGARVLLAEDNRVNQDVAIGMLEQSGCIVQLASDGEEAVEIAGKEEFDLILMDCQMPRMDGYTASRKIKRPGGKNAETPVVALTANVMEGDRERCLSSGMDDYLCKPVSSGALAEKLDRWLAIEDETRTAVTTRTDVVDVSESVVVGKNFMDPAREHSHSEDGPPIYVDGTRESDQLPSLPVGRSLEDKVSASAQAAVSAPSKNTPALVNPDSVIDPAAIRAIEALQQPGKESLLGRVIGIYLDKSPTLIDDMSKALGEDNPEAVAAGAHSLKSSSAYLGAEQVVDDCLAIEMAVSENDQVQLGELMQKVRHHYDLAASALSLYL